jgi:uncharacterized protein
MTELEIIALIAMVVGLIGVIVPVLPGLLLILGAGIVWAVAQDAGASGWAVVVAMGVLAAVGTVAPYRLSGRRASAVGVPGWVLFAGAVGAVIGFFVIPVVGALIGGPAGIFVAELLRHRNPRVAWRSTVEAMKGIGIGVLIQFGVGVAMIGVWVLGVITT